MPGKLYWIGTLAALGMAALATGEVADESVLDALLSEYAVRPIVEPAAERAVDPAAPLTFLVAGHLYGEPGRPDAVGPAETFTSHVDRLRDLRPAFFVSLGDLVRGPTSATIGATLAALRRLDAPVYNAVGNHDVVPSRDVYVGRFGRTFGGFRRGASLFLVLDTELDPWRISGEQLDFLRRAMGAAPEAGIERVFLFSHRVLFATDDSPYGVVFRHCNSRQSWPGSSNFASDVLPLLVAFREVGEVVWFSGDVGVRWSYGLFHETDPETGIRYLAVGLGDEDWDCVVSVHVAPDGKVALARIPLKDPDMPDLDACGLDAWSERFEKDR